MEEYKTAQNLPLSKNQMDTNMLEAAEKVWQEMLEYSNARGHREGT